MTMLEIVKMWNEKKASYYRAFEKGVPSQLGSKVQELITEYGEQEVEEYFKFMVERPERDIWKVATKSMYKTYLDIKNRTPKEEEAPKVIVEAPKAEQSSAQNINVLELLSTQIVNLMGSELANKIGTEVEAKINGFVQDKILMKVVEYDGKRNEIKGVVHEQFETILKFVAMDEPVMLVGPAGTGKNIIAKQVADALGLDFYFTSAVSQEYKLTGYGDATGNYVPTQFYDWAINGGLFLFDEMDASIAEALVVVNSAIANRYFDFPVVGRVYLNEKCRIVACANTYGTGASMEYVGRNQLDGATLNRFGMVEVNYDKRIEDAVCPDKDIADFCRNFRSICDKNGVHHIISYREMSRLYKMIVKAELDKAVAIKTCLTKGLEKDTLNIILNDMKDTVEYKKYFKEMLNNIQ